MNIKHLRQSLALVDWTLTTQFGVDIRKLIRGILSLPWFVKSYLEFSRKSNRLPIAWMPCLHDRFDSAGAGLSSEYFWQDLFVAQCIYRLNPKSIMDVGSRVDGYVAHVATFRELVVADLREQSSCIPHISQIRIDLTDQNYQPEQLFDCVTCLHAIEHFGLGRYGDPINHDGWIFGIRNLCASLKTDGFLYLSFPAGKRRVVFNAHNIFDLPEVVSHLAFHRVKVLEAWTISPGMPKVSPLELSALRQSLQVDYQLLILKGQKSASPVAYNQ